MIRQYLSHYPEELGIDWAQFVGLGRVNPEDPNEKFSMSVLACNLSQEVNGVSWLHGEVSKEILGDLWPGYFKNELHIGYVTNGVHFPTWTATRLRRLYARYFPEGFEGHEYRISEWKKVYDIPDEDLWQERMVLKEKLVRLIRRRYCDPGQVRMDSPHQVMQVLESIKPDVLKIGFARRFATYKRALLLFTDLIAWRPSSTTRSVPCSLSLRARRIPTISRDRISSSGSSKSQPCRSSPARSSSCRITTWSWRVAWCRAWTCGSIPYSSARGVGYVG